MEEKKNYSIENIKQSLEENGYAVVNSIISEEQCEKFKSEMWNYLESLECGIIKDKPETWAKNLPGGEKGIIKGLCIGQQQCVWDIRQNEKVYDIFSQIWNDPQLLVSMDAVNVQIGPELGGESEESYGPLFHVDQGAHRKGKLCIQGAVNLEDQGELDGGFCCWKKSHLYFQEFFEHEKYERTSDFFVHSNEQLQWFMDKGLKPEKILAPKGSLILWDSRTIHTAVLPSNKRNNPKNVRFVVYVCMMPKKNVGEDVIQKKIQIFNQQSHTNHWANQAREDEFYYSTSRYRVKPVDVKLTSIGKKLLGLEEY